MKSRFGLGAFALAVAAVVGLLTVYPMVWLLIGSLKVKGGGFGFARYGELFAGFTFLPVLLNSWVFALGTMIMSLGLGIVLAVLVARTDMPGKRFFRLTAMFAFVSPPWLTAMAYVFIASPNAGYANVLIDQLIGVKPFNIQSMGGMIFVSGLFLYAFVFLTLEGALSSIDGAYEEAARTAGARALTVVCRVTLPLVMPAIISASVFSLVISWGLFAVPAILGMPSRIFVFSTQLYLFLNEFPPKLELAAAMGVLFCLTALVLGLVVFAFRRRQEAQRFAVVTGKGSRPALLPLGRIKPVAVLFAAVLALLSVFIPYAVILWMSLKSNWYSVGGFGDLSLENFIYVATEYRAFWTVVGNTLKVSALEAAIVLVVAGSVAYLALRTQVTGRNVIVAGAYYTTLVPSVAFLSGVIWAWVGSPLGLYGGLTLIALTQAARSLPIATRNIGDGFRQIDRALEEAATICGGGRWRIAAQINLPLLRPVIFSAFAIVFLSSLRELNTPLFIGGGTPASTTLSVVIFQFWSESRMGESAALTIILLLLTLAIFLPFSRFFRRQF